MNLRILNLCGAALALTANCAVAQQITIIPVGDSITAGFSSQMSFREELDARLTASGCTYVSRGALNNDGFQGAGGRHEGYPGQRADHFDNDGQGPNPGIGPTLDNDFALNSDYPEVLLLNLGTNDVIRGIELGHSLTQTVDSTMSDIAELISIIHGRDPNIEIFLGNLTPLYADEVDASGDLVSPATSEENHPFADALSDELESAYLGTTVPGVTLVDLRTGYRSTDMVFDGIHPSPNTGPNSDSGEHRLAVAFAAALEEQGFCSPAGADNSFPLTDILTPTNIDGETFNGAISFTGRAIDTGGAGFTNDGNGLTPRVRIAIQDNNHTSSNDQYWNFSNGGFGTLDTIDASLTQRSANYVDWSTPSVALPAGDYTIFALARDDDGNENYTGPQNQGFQWPERLQFIVGNGGGNSGGPLLQEAESGTLSGDMTITNDNGVSGGQFVEVPGSGAVDDFFAHYVEFSITIATAGSYQINAGVRGPAGNQNSFFAQIDDGTRYEWHIPQNNQLLEDLVSDRVNGNDIDITETLGVGDHTLRIFGREAGAQLDWIEFELIGGATEDTCNGLVPTVIIANGDPTTAGDDVILGTSGADTINGLGGNDTICGLGGDDVINAGGGDDWVEGGAGSDNIFGGGGSDSLYGGSGDDLISGSSGDDDIEGNDGDDILLGQVGDDTIDGGSGVDEIGGGPGSDTIFTGTGATVGSGIFVTGGGGGDFIFGGADADDLRGGGGADTIRGGAGDDEITGGVGRDEIFGEDGDDDIRGQQSIDTLDGGAGRDTITGGSAGDIIRGGPGNDTLIGGSGDDEIFGDAGNDNIQGGSDDDTLDGGSSGGDVCAGQSGTDTATSSCEAVTGVP